MLFYPAALPLSTSTPNRVAGLIRSHRKHIGSRWRVLDPGRQALLTLADKGYIGLDADPVVTPYKGRGKPEHQKEADGLHARLRAPGERAFAQLKKWSVFDRFRCDPNRTTQIAKAVQILNDYERQVS